MAVEMMSLSWQCPSTLPLPPGLGPARIDPAGQRTKDTKNIAANMDMMSNANLSPDRVCGVAALALDVLLSVRLPWGFLSSPFEQHAAE